VRCTIAPPADLRAFLIGGWILERVILDRRAGRVYRFVGALDVGALDVGARALDTLEWHEHGRLFAGSAELEATRTMRIVSCGPLAADLLLETGDVLGHLDFARGRARVTYSCGTDRYRGIFVTGPDELWIRWRCTGATKDYVATTRCHRAGAADHVD